MRGATLPPSPPCPRHVRPVVLSETHGDPGPSDCEPAIATNRIKWAWSAPERALAAVGYEVPEQIHAVMHTELQIEAAHVTVYGVP